MAGESAPLVLTLGAQTDAIAAGASGSDSLRAPVAGVVTSVTYIPAATITGATTNNRTVSVVNRGQAGAGTTVVATLTFASGVNAPAFDEKAIPLSATAADLVVAVGDVLEFRSVFAGTGIADPGGTVNLTLSRS